MIMSRRSAISLILSVPSATGLDFLFGNASAQAKSVETANQISVEQWMSSWMSVTRPVAGALYLMRFRDPIYVLTRPITWTPKNAQKDIPKVVVPKGFVTDFASIPRVFWSLVKPDGNYAYPAVIHDYLYWEQISDRATADQIFKMAMSDFKIEFGQAETIYAAVRAGGSAAWEANKRLKANGEKRVLKRFPEDPLVTWAEWKANPNVF